MRLDFLSWQGQRVALFGPGSVASLPDRANVVWLAPTSTVVPGIGKKLHVRLQT
jgi:hypothetical protein